MGISSLVVWFETIEILYKEHDSAILGKDKPSCFGHYLAIGLEPQTVVFPDPGKRPAMLTSHMSLNDIDRCWLVL
ncbi:hypothetical protein HRbin08_02021 [bacterium HR08]|nr:hypothetical protein HRbin08_02021 [bacterium HR08]